ncbi:MAG: N-acetylmuramoyl-L-alanine amidase [Verrucomicrobiaceae bacterium]|nr:N-acetylmuramoyl-L-alanine amidase [Verrucomicrobiaceae bacterium]
MAALMLAPLMMVAAVRAAGLPFSTVVIDAGHGGRDGGAVWNGLLERNLTLDVAKRLDAALRARGVRTLMTRRSDTTVELSTRAVIANRCRSAVFVSIHFNACRDRSASGIETHYRSARGKELALSVQRSLDKRVTGINRNVSYADYKVLRETRMPAVLVECGFISNKKEARLCASPAHRQKLAEAIATGILEAKK